MGLPRHPQGPERIGTRRNSQLAVAEATSTDTPGPMVELIETFFM